MHKGRAAYLEWPLALQTVRTGVEVSGILQSTLGSISYAKEAYEVVLLEERGGPWAQSVRQKMQTVCLP